MNQYERNVLEHIEKFGCSVTSVFDPKGTDPPFSYSIGIARSCDAPEVIVVGLSANLGKSLVNAYRQRVLDGERFAYDTDYHGLLEGFPVRFGPVARAERETRMCSACWLHEGSDFTAIQLIWPDAGNRAWPWEAHAPEWMRREQPLLAGDAGIAAD